MSLITLPGGVLLELRQVSPAHVVPVASYPDPDGETAEFMYPVLPVAEVDVWVEQWLAEVALLSATERFAGTYTPSEP